MSSGQHGSHRGGSRVAPYVFGIQTLPLVASGVYTLLWPAAAAGLPNSPLQGLSNGTIQALSLTSLSLGSFYAIAACQNNTPMMMAAIPGRLLAMVVFYRSGGGWKNVAPFEGLMGLFTAFGLYWDWYTARPAEEEEKQE
ncbi:hypothetical protein N7462_008078 [Penicillium macrosclerotiorum]|uniref:uncharacterized protein n=1 Tax=Penicillium macrosclerotiorum TaxID=303699 RepID=UPI002546791C|nr:uncharacterized protein N7462_008078 [Penicillium macrosclerotiorum]KAJ5679834.1 hypothetical protein N7462_008078 [Penicillium macrosclerotiorum]